MGNHEVKSNFVRNLIRGRRFSDKRQRKYIGDLVLLERFITPGIHGMGAWQGYNTLKTKYKKEWEIIYRELKPKEFKRFIAYEKHKVKEEALERDRERREAKKERDAWKQQWLRLGGRE